MPGSTSAPQLPGYRDLAPLGRGGYSEVYRAYQDHLDRWVAVKVLTFALADDRTQRRFLRECRVAGRLSAHPNIATVYDAGISPDGRPYISMELYDRGSIADRLRSGTPFGVADVLLIAIGLAGALETAHRAGVVHRDVKPANVLLASYGQPALTDFGLSILAERQEVSAAVDALTPYHAPPEVLERTAVTPAADVYSLASTTYAMLAGRAPHQRGDAQDTMASLLLRILQTDVPPVGRHDVPASLDAALRAALARDPHARTPSALGFAEALQQVQAELGLEATRAVVMDPAESSEVAGPPGAPLHPSPGALTVPTDSPGPALRREVTLAYGAPQVPAPERVGPTDQPVPPAPRWPAPGGGGPDGSPVDAGPDGPPDTDETVHRDVVRRARALEPPPPEPSRLRRRLLVLGAVIIVAGAGAGAFLALRGDDSGRSGPGTTTTTGGATTTPTGGDPSVLETPRDLTATESEAGVQLTWEGDDTEQYVVLVMSEAEPPELMPAEAGASYLVPAPTLTPDVGYCFAVALVSTLESAPADQAAQAFGPPACIRGASEGTVLGE